MPRNDGMGPRGHGPMTGRRGNCESNQENQMPIRERGRFDMSEARPTHSRGRRRSNRMSQGFGVGMNCQSSFETREAFLNARKIMLQAQLEIVNNELDSI